MAIYSKVSGIGASVIKSIDGISISKVRSINASLSSAFALLLDERYGFGAEAAYSVRRLSGVYNGPLLVVRRDSDDATLEVGFTFNNDLDVSAIETFCGTANGYVTEWRDQSGNLNHAAQTAETSQPKIYDATTGIELNAGRPVLNFAGDFFDLTRTITTDPLALFSMHRDSGNRYFPLYQDSNNYVFYHTTYGQLRSRLSGQFAIENYSSKGEMGLRSFIQYTDGSEARSYVNGVDVTHVGGYQITTQQGSFTDLGLAGTGYTGLAQEVIVYSANKSGDRTDIEENIAGYYGDNVELLDTYSGAAAAYSLRKLSSSYSGPLVRVREDGGDTQADIYANVFGELDTIALADHCGSNNGLVVGWYDQSGNLNNATQPALTSQPKIYDGTTGVVTENGKPAVHYQTAAAHHVLSKIDTIETAFLLYSPSATMNRILSIPNTTNTAIKYHAAVDGTQTYFSMLDTTDQVNGNIDRQSNISGQSLITTFDSTNSFYNGSNFDGSGTQYFTKRTNNAVIGARGDGSFGSIIHVQELIMFSTDQDSNRTNIEDNINDFYGIYDAGLIGEYGGAAAAYSLRSLSSVYDGAAITVRRDSDDSTKNIYFDSDGNLDTAALIGFCTNNNGYIVRWFDQSGNLNHATQSADTAQPKIYDGTTGVVTENGKPAVQFDGTNDGFKVSYASTAVDAVSMFAVTAGATKGQIFGSQDLSTGVRVYAGASINRRWEVRGGSTNTYQYNGINGQAQMTGLFIANSQKAYENGVSKVTGTTAYTGYYLNDICIGQRSSNANYTDAKIQEFFFYGSDQSANRTGIEANINNEYLIYQPDTAPTSGLLASYPGVTSAYSLRQLSNEAVIAVTVRRDSDDNVSPIGFDGRELDTEALAAWCGNSNGYVTTWWDQSLNQINGTQGSLTSQPKIYDASTGVVTKNGKPAIEFDGANDNMTLNFPGTSNTAHFVIVGAPTATSFVNYVRDYAGNNFRLRLTTPAGGGFSADHRTPGGTVSAGLTLPDFSQFVQTALITPTTVATHLNGVGNSASFTNTVSLRNNGDIPRDGNIYTAMLLQEFMVYPSDQTSNRTGIENNIFDFYTGYLLDQYSGAAAAYSLRALSSTATNAVQVRRDSDDATQYIGFVQDGFSLSLDTSALSTFCGSANGYVTEWVDQSGNGNNAIQPAFTAQPKIYDSVTGVVTKNGKPAITGVSSSSRLSIASLMSLNDFCISMVYEEYRANKMTWGHDTTYYNYHTGSGGRVNNMLSWTSNINVGDQGLYFLNRASSSAELHMNSSSLVTSTYGSIYYFQDLFNAHTNTFGYIKPIQEFILWQSDQSTNRTNIEDNINGYYDIY